MSAKLCDAYIREHLLAILHGDRGIVVSSFAEYKKVKIALQKLAVVTGDTAPEVEFALSVARCIMYVRGGHITMRYENMLLADFLDLVRKRTERDIVLSGYGL